ncbi:pyridoxal-phosphate dependent enzyme [Aeromonas caviae]|uniref:pyridoxal-phosphate dependent enzyme n=1 Tax=Aeromonas caviae TaxID=648 RepID=UPI000A7E9B28
MQTLKKLSERLGNHVSLKREDLQPVHSFKLRGAYHKIATLTQEQKNARHRRLCRQPRPGGRPVGRQARHQGDHRDAKTTPDIKIDAVRRQGGNVMLFGNSFDEAYGESRRLAELEGYTLIPPFDDVEVIAGQGTIGKELLEQDTHLTHVFVPVGGGGLAAGGGGLHQAAAAGCKR